MTRQEVKLWDELRELRAIGYHFRRQSPLAGYVVDIECRGRALSPMSMAINMASMKIVTS